MFRFCLHVVVNNAFQLHKVQDRSSSQFITLDNLGFRRATAVVYLSSTSRAEAPKRFPQSRQTCKEQSDIRFDGKIIGLPKEHNTDVLLEME